MSVTIVLCFFYFVLLFLGIFLEKNDVWNTQLIVSFASSLAFIFYMFKTRTIETHGTSGLLGATMLYADVLFLLSVLCPILVWFFGGAVSVTILAMFVLIGASTTVSALT